MNAKANLVLAALLGSLSGAFFLGLPATASETDAYAAFRAQGVACAGGYHLDGNGSCQPNGGQASLQPCPLGQLAQPYPNGSSYRCEPIPESYRQYFR
jgi:hypothetical protein